MLPLELHGIADAQDRAQNFLERVELGERLDHYPSQLSGGEQQRVARRASSPEPEEETEEHHLEKTTSTDLDRALTPSTVTMAPQTFQCLMGTLTPTCDSFLTRESAIQLLTPAIQLRRVPCPRLASRLRPVATSPAAVNMLHLREYCGISIVSV